MKNSLQISFVVILLFFLSSCATKVAKIFPERANAEMDFENDVPVDFRQGWKDGCEVGMNAGANTFYKMFYRSNKVDGYKMAYSKDYKTAWGNAFWFCYRHDHIKHKSSLWGSFFGGYK